ncbi:MAG: hypothetical protein D3916_05090 [Candidatus Electrothrix sp. MAN1_4]|nr:hypothetical protein [Candidatus Electrothrix sp. MAN1_4]
MKYEEIAKECEALSYRDKLRLAQLLIQLARKEEEIENPSKRGNLDRKIKSKGLQNDTKDVDSIQYVIDRLAKLRPSKKKTLLNSIQAMYQFQGGVSEEDQEKILKDLVRCKFIKVESNNRITYLDVAK